MNTLPDHLATAPLSWWRAYMRAAVRTYEGITKQPITSQEKRALWWRLKYNRRVLGAIGSYTTLAIMTHVFKDEVVK